jgi:membrane complex biogenesis BtpA family protein
VSAVSLFSRERKTIVGMIHVAALPGTPRHRLPLPEIIAAAAAEARLYAECGVDAIMIENMHDRPYLKGTVGPEITAAMTAVALAVRAAAPALACGIQILAAANREALSVAATADLAFIRAEGFVFAHVADEGLIESDAASLLRYRKQIGAEEILILTDIKKKHSSHALTADLGLADTARAAEFFLSDGLVVTGTHTGAVPDLEDIRAARAATTLPILLGSGVTTDNVRELLVHADAAIIGSHFKREGRWENPVDPERVKTFVAALWQG